MNRSSAHRRGVPERLRTDQEQRCRHPEQRDTKEENPSLKVLFEHVRRPVPVNPPEESDSETHHLWHDWNEDQRQHRDRKLQHGKHLEGV